jgi:hypothetical protein
VRLDFHVHLTVYDDETGLKRLPVHVPHGHLVRSAVRYQLPDQTVIELNAMMLVMNDEPALPAASLFPGITAVAMFSPDDISLSTYRASAHNP